MRLGLVLVALTMGCTSNKPATPTPSAESVDTTPARYGDLKALLQARHPEDLPDDAAIDAHGGLPGLRWLAENDPALVLRERALLLLSRRVDADTHATCAGIFRDGPHPKVRAAAIGCLDPEAVASDTDLAAALQAAVSDPDPRVAEAARVWAEQHPSDAVPADAPEDPG